MQIISRVIQAMMIMVGMGVFTMPVFAESAPVYDADSMQQQFENANSDQGQDLPPPPPPGQEGNTFAPAQAQAAPAQSVAQGASTEGATQAFVPSGQVPSQDQDNNASRHLSTSERLNRIEQQVNNLQGNASASRLDSLQNEVQSLRGQVEQLTHQLQQVQSQQKNLYTDLDKRLQNTGKATRSTITQEDLSDKTSANAAGDDAPVVTKRKNIASKAAAKSASAVDVAATDTTAKEADAAKALDNQPNVAEEQQIYQTAYNLIKAKKYNDAANVLQEMLHKYPSGQFASNAHYWLGELYGLMGKTDQALNEFSTVVKSYSNSPRISDAQLKVGLIYASQLKWVDAKLAFKKVINHYPGTASARLAAEQLKQIKQAGH